jgi:hypothetical protein
MRLPPTSFQTSPCPKRTVRKPIRWTPQEWSRVEDAARARGIPPLRFVREALVGQQARVREVEPDPVAVAGPAFIKRVRRKASRVLRLAETWEELVGELRRRDLSLRARRAGILVTDGRVGVLTSDVDPTATRLRLERRLGSFREYRERRARAGLDDRGPRPPTYGEVVRRFARLTRELYAEPQAARRAFLALADRIDPGLAAVVICDDPERFGRLWAGATADQAFRWWESAFDYAALRPKSARPSLTEIARLLRLAGPPLRARAELDRATVAASQQAKTAESLHLRRRDGVEAVRALHAGAVLVYQDPGSALRGMNVHYRRFGVRDTVLALRTCPERFGLLRERAAPGLWGLMRGRSTMLARYRAKFLVSALLRAAWTYGHRPPAGLLTLAVARADDAEHLRRLADERYAGLKLDPTELIGQAAWHLEMLTRFEPLDREARLRNQLRPMLPRFIEEAESGGELMLNAEELGLAGFLHRSAGSVADDAPLLMPFWIYA